MPPPSRRFPCLDASGVGTAALRLPVGLYLDGNRTVDAHTLYGLQSSNVIAAS